MPFNNSNNQKNTNTNLNLKSSIVHKPFATGTINIFNPYRNKSNKSDSEASAPKLFLDAQLEKSPETETETETELKLESQLSEIKYREHNWLDTLFSPWSISAIAIILLANLISGAFIWRTSRLAADNKAIESLTTLGSADLAVGEFTPLNLSTLSTIDPIEKTEKSPIVVPISPALAPIDNVSALSSIDPEYYYVLTDYTGDRSIALAQQKVKQVSLVNLTQGAFIYLGAFRDREQANEFVSQLNQEDFAARVYPLD